MSAPELRQCRRCIKLLPISEFTVKSTGRINVTCKRCCATQTAHFMEHNDRHGKKYYALHRQRILTIRKEVIEHYGGQCACCGETRYEFLALDHKDGLGAEHRTNTGLSGGSRTVVWAKNNGFPDIFQILCHNCNTAKGRKPFCPCAAFDPMTLAGAC
jgi:hypothetical protein